MTSEKITIYEGCDPQLAISIRKFTECWGPYSATSRRYSIYRLMRELIDPAWLALQIRYPRLDTKYMDLAWKKYHFEHFFAHSKSEDYEDESPAQKQKRAEVELAPCAGKINGTYVLSEIARQHGFYELETFFIWVCRMLGEGTDCPSSASFESLGKLALACRLKRPKTDKAGGEKFNARRAHLRPYCKSCGQKTELSTHRFEAAPSQSQDAEDTFLPSSQYCTTHRPKAPLSKSVRSKYFRVKRSQVQFEVELARLERQVIGQTSRSSNRNWARSGNSLVDDFYRHFVGDGLSELLVDDPKLRDAARLLVDDKISDRKKEIIMLLTSGLNQNKAALKIGVERQAVHKALFKIPAKYRFDLISAA